MKRTISQQLKHLNGLDAEALRVEWHRHFKFEPRSMRRDFMLAEIACHLQQKAHGGLSATVKNKLERMAFGHQQQTQPKFTVTTGTRLVREWNGTQHVVIADADGYEYQGARYRSLSNIACKITGTRWSGPLFFGLKKQKGSHEKAA